MSTPKRPSRSRAPKNVYQLHVQLEYLEPAIWRRLWVPDTLMLDRLDRVIQTAMGWKNAHLHAFDVGSMRYAIPDPEWTSTVETRDERLWDLAAVLAEGTSDFVYTYDFGDDWRHRIKVEAVLQPNEKNRLSLCVAGANACPPEDVGGLPGYSDFLLAIVDPLHPEHVDMWQWNGGPFDPNGFDLNAVNAAMRKLRR
ncbi:MAG: plasmid pRiA4b ORF-3 family protein [Pseudomonadota bacterium]